MAERFYVFRDTWKRNLARCFDFLGDPIASFWGYKKKPDYQKINKVLLTRIDHLGDALLMRPAIAELHRAHPHLIVHVLTTPENMPVFLLDPFVDQVIPYPGHWFEKFSSRISQFFAFFKILKRIRSEHYDAAVDFRGDVRISALFFLAGIPVRCGYGITGGGWMLTDEKNWGAETHQVMLNRSLLGDWTGSVQNSYFNPPMRFPESTPFKLRPKIRDLGSEFIVIHAGAGNPQKEASRDLLAALIQQLSLVCKIEHIVLVGTAAEKNRTPAPISANIFDLRGLTDLYELACLFKRAALFIGSDSGPAHLAAAQGLQVAVLSSKTNDIRYWHPWTEKIAILPPAASAEEIVSAAKDLKPEVFKNEADITV